MPRGRPALNNVRHLYDAILEASTANRPLTLGQICERFHWTPGTARSMISRVRSEYGVRVSFNRRSGYVRLTVAVPPASVPVIPAPESIPEPVGIVDTVEILARAMHEHTPRYSTEDCAYWINRHAVAYSFYPEVLRNRIRAFDRGEPCRISLTQETVSAIVSAMPDSLFRGIPNEVANFYRERALDLAR